MGGIKSPSDKSANKAKSLLITSSSTSHRFDNQVKLYSCFVVFSKYLSLACFSLALISVITLNIITSYSTSQISSRAEPVSNLSGSDQRDIGPTGISISISSSSSTGGNNADLSLLIPQGGGLAVGRHTITVKTGSNVIGYSLTLSSDSAETGLVNDDIADNKTAIPTTAGTLARPSTLADKTYGYTRTDLSSNGAYDNSTAGKTYTDNPLANTAIWSGIRPSSNPDTIATVDEADLAVGQTNSTAHSIYYGVNVQDPATTQAGEYSRRVIYTATGELAPEPTISNITPMEYPINNKTINVSNAGIDTYAVTADGKAHKYNKYNEQMDEWSNIAFPFCDLAIYEKYTSMSSSSSALCQDGRLYVWGNNKYGQLGTGNTETVNDDSPVDISGLLDGNIQDAFINASSIALTDSGQVYAWGRNDSGQLGTGDFDNRLSPINITGNFLLTGGDSVVAIRYVMQGPSAFTLTSSGRLFTWGGNFGGQLGNGDTTRSDQPLPVEITSQFKLGPGEKIIDVQAGRGSIGGTVHVLALTNTGRVFAWGINDCGQLGDGAGGNGAYAGRKLSPVEITSYFNLGADEKIGQILVGHEASSYAITNHGRLFGWGAWYWSRTVQTTPLDITDKFVNPNITQLAYNQPIYALDNTSKIYASSKDANATWTAVSDPGYVAPTITLTGTNLSGVTNVYIDLSGDGAMQSNEQCTNLTIKSDTELTCDAPTDDSIATGDYTMYIETPYNHTTAIFHYDHY